MRKKGIQGFTLMELMATLLIIGIILAVSGPVYTSFTIKSRFAEVLGIINGYRNDLATAYLDNDKFPSSFSNLTVSTYNAVSSPVLQQIYYGVSTNSQAAYLRFYTKNLGILGYVQSNTSGATGISCRITMVARIVSTGQIQYSCGQWDGSTMDVPLTYLPSGCQDTNLSALIT
ncbi:MAG TPA: prepilin-type N-terminal cleavage/methylation domain-containing protein [Gammaproteobacteria bacterium]|nr:prepilin-type N-terminal cleavage/methylation domain-containing protein [Gammaproteobacteria bacterium]